MSEGKSRGRQGIATRRATRSSAPVETPNEELLKSNEDVVMQEAPAIAKREIPAEKIHSSDAITTKENNNIEGTAEDVQMKENEEKPEDSSEEKDENEQVTPNGKDENVKSGKRRHPGGGPTIRKKRKKLHVPQQPKNALTQLNEMKPGLKYVVESQEGPPHEPVFVVSVEVNGQNYVGRGHSKRLAKHAAAQAALESFVQFRDMPEAMNVVSRQIKDADFTADNVENEASIFNKFDQRKNGAGEINSKSLMEDKINRQSLKAITEADKKNPVMLLNELHPGLAFVLTKENLILPSQRFCMSVEVNGESFEGYGQSKKLAKAAAARSVLSKLYSVSFNLHAFVPSPTSDVDPELFNFPQTTADKIAKCIQDTFGEVMSNYQDYAKWKVLAGVVMTKDEAMEDVQVISIGTGTKHLNGEHISMIGATLNDCHAEIISRRCLKNFFYTQLELHVEGEGDQSIFVKEDGKFYLRPMHKFHLFISTSPCGDARIFCPHEGELPEPVDKHPNRKARGLLRTKIESGEGTIPIQPGQSIQTWDAIIHGQQRFLTMSCSDKIASWNLCGVQGALLSHFIEPIYFESIILGRLFHPNHMHRAMIGRIESAELDLPPPYRHHKPKMCATTSLETRQLAKSPNFSVNWTVGNGRPEIINARTGKTEGNEVSRLSKRSFFERYIGIYKHLSGKIGKEAAEPHLYVSIKNSATDYRKTKEQLHKAFSDNGLGIWVKRPVEQEEFELTF